LLLKTANGNQQLTGSSCSIEVVRWQCVWSVQSEISCNGFYSAVANGSITLPWHGSYSAVAMVAMWQWLLL